jgi:hypothetical protein
MYYSTLYDNNTLQTHQTGTNHDFGFANPYENNVPFDDCNFFGGFSNFLPVNAQATNNTDIPLNDAFLWQPLLTQLTDVFDSLSNILSDLQTSVSTQHSDEAEIQVKNDFEEDDNDNNNGKINHKKHRNLNNKDDKYSKHKKNDKHGGSHGDYTGEMLGIIDDLEEKGINIKDSVKDAYAKGKKAIGGRKVKGNENRDVRSLMDDEVKSAAEDTMKQISKYIEKNPNDTEFLDTVADWIKLGLHDGHDNKNNMGTHALESAQGKGGLAFQLAHFMNVGNDTTMGINNKYTLTNNCIKPK